MEQESQALITAAPAFAGFDLEFENLKKNLSGWIGDAVRAPRISSGLTQLCQELERAISRGMISLPARFRVARLDSYARRLVYDDPETGVCVLAMIWAPGQATPLHDHSGLWGVEAVPMRDTAAGADRLTEAVRAAFVAGAVASGRETSRIFIENGRFHGEAIVATIVSRRSRAVSAG